MAHCVHSDRRECDAMRRAGVVVAHCAGSNINLCSGVSPVPGRCSSRAFG